MQHVDWFWLVTRWLHILAVVTAIGGSLYSYFAFVPASEEALEEPARAKVREAARRRWAILVHMSIAVLLITGGINFVMAAIPPGPPKVPAIPYHAIFGVKLIAALVVFFLASALLGRGAGFARLRERSRPWFGAIVLLGILIIFLSGMLNQIRNGATQERTDTARETASLRQTRTIDLSRHS